MDGVYVDLRESGLLWLINRQVFHPRGFALAMALDDDGALLGWILQGDGREPWSFATDIEAEPFAAAQRTLAPRDTRPRSEPGDDCRVCSTGHVCHEHQAQLIAGEAWKRRDPDTTPEEGR